MTDTLTNNDVVVVTQEDREAAANWFSPDCREDVLAGKEDRSPVTQSFARYRKQVIERCANIAERKSAVLGEPFCDVASDLATAIRSLGEGL